MPQPCWIALGGNLGNVRKVFRLAMQRLEQLEKVGEVRLGRLYRSAAMGSAAGEDFWNAVAFLESMASPRELMHILQDIERECGRTREFHWGPRTLDLDLIYYGSEQVHTPELTIPHAGRSYRRFVLDPLADMQPEWPDPEYGLSVRQLQQRLVASPRQLWLPELMNGLEFHRLEQFIQARWPDVRCERQAMGTFPPQGLCVYTNDMDVTGQPGLHLTQDLHASESLSFIEAAATAAFSVPVPCDSLSL